MQFDQFNEVMTDTECLSYCKEMLRSKKLVVVKDGNFICVKRFRKNDVVYTTYNLGTLLENVESGYFDQF